MVHTLTSFETFDGLTSQLPPGSTLLDAVLVVQRLIRSCANRAENQSRST